MTNETKNKKENKEIEDTKDMDTKNMNTKANNIDEYDLFGDDDLSPEVQEKVDNAYKLADIIVELVKKRVALGMSQRDLAKKTDIKQPMIARIESLKVVPRLDTIIKISHALDMEFGFVNKNKFDQKYTININFTKEEEIQTSSQEKDGFLGYSYKPSTANLDCCLVS